MDGRTIDEVVKALRSAVRGLRAAEKALLQAPRDNSPVREVAGDPKAPDLDNDERLLQAFFFEAASYAKKHEEEDPQSFRARFEPMKADLQEAVLRGDMYQVTPQSAGMVSFDNTPGTTLYEQCLKGMRNNDLHAADIVGNYVESPDLKNWGDIDINKDLVFMRYETPGPITAHLDEDRLSHVLENGRKIPGAIDRCRTALAEKGIDWEITDQRTGEPATTMAVSGVEGKWAACIDVDKILGDVVNRLSAIEVDYDNDQEGWWDAARIDRNMPQQLLPIIRGKEKGILLHKTDVDSIEDWAAQLPGWYDGTEDNPTPLVVRDAVANDILI